MRKLSIKWGGIALVIALSSTVSIFSSCKKYDQDNSTQWKTVKKRLTIRTFQPQESPFFFG